MASTVVLQTKLGNALHHLHFRFCSRIQTAFPIQPSYPDGTLALVRTFEGSVLFRYERWDPVPVFVSIMGEYDLRLVLD